MTTDPHATQPTADPDPLPPGWRLDKDGVYCNEYGDTIYTLLMSRRGMLTMWYDSARDAMARVDELRRPAPQPHAKSPTPPEIRALAERLERAISIRTRSDPQAIADHSEVMTTAQAMKEPHCSDGEWSDHLAEAKVRMVAKIVGEFLERPAPAVDPAPDAAGDIVRRAGETVPFVYELPDIVKDLGDRVAALEAWRAEAGFEPVAVAPDDEDAGIDDVTEESTALGRELIEGLSEFRDALAAGDLSGFRQTLANKATGERRMYNAGDWVRIRSSDGIGRIAAYPGKEDQVGVLVEHPARMLGPFDIIDVEPCGPPTGLAATVNTMWPSPFACPNCGDIMLRAGSGSCRCFTCGNVERIVERLASLDDPDAPRRFRCVSRKSGKRYGVYWPRLNRYTFDTPGAPGYTPGKPSFDGLEWLDPEPPSSPPNPDDAPDGSKDRRDIAEEPEPNPTSWTPKVGDPVRFAPDFGRGEVVRYDPESSIVTINTPRGHIRYYAGEVEPIEAATPSPDRSPPRRTIRVPAPGERVKPNGNSPEGFVDGIRLRGGECRVTVLMPTGVILAYDHDCITHAGSGPHRWVEITLLDEAAPALSAPVAPDRTSGGIVLAGEADGRLREEWEPHPVCRNWYRHQSGAQIGPDGDDGDRWHAFMPNGNVIRDRGGNWIRFTSRDAAMRAAEGAAGEASKPC